MLIKNAKFYIAPYSPMSQTFLKSLKLENSNFLGFIDSNKKGEDIYKAEEIKETNYDFIYIVSPNHSISIYNYYKQIGIKTRKVKFIEIIADNFTFSSFYKFYFKQKYISYRNSVFKYLMQNFKSKFEDNRTILFLAVGFIDLNIKDLYLYLKKNTSYNPKIVTNNKKQMNQFRKEGFDVISFLSMDFFYYSLKSKIKILDHSPVEKETLLSLINSKIIQIWHGIPLKKIGHMTNYKSVKYDVIVSTSDFVTNYSFGKLFNTNKFLNSGYPRNDILSKKIFENDDLVLTNKEIFNFIKNSGKKVFVYMPTWRPQSDAQNPIDLEELNSFTKDNDFLIVIKNHPFTREGSFYSSVIDANKYYYSKNYKYNVLFYPTTDDIYPVLSISDALITDYSSVYFDYLLVNKPIVFFVYDLDEYILTHGEFMLDFEEYTPGEKAIDFEQLKNSMLKTISNDQYKDLRETLRDKLFENINEKSCKLLQKEINVLMGKR